MFEDIVIDQLKNKYAPKIYDELKNAEQVQLSPRGVAMTREIRVPLSAQASVIFDKETDNIKISAYMESYKGGEAFSTSGIFSTLPAADITEVAGWLEYLFDDLKRKALYKMAEAIVKEYEERKKAAENFDWDKSPI